MKVINGRWVNDQGETLTTPDEHNKFQETLMRVKSFSQGKRLTERKVNVLFKILSTNDDMDNALTTILSMDNSQIKRLF
jgi:hypothetical protein